MIPNFDSPVGTTRYKSLRVKVIPLDGIHGHMMSLKWFMTKFLRRETLDEYYMQGEERKRVHEDAWSQVSFEYNSFIIYANE